MFENDLEDLVSVEGVVHLATTLGVFLDTQGRRMCLSTAWKRHRKYEHSSQAKP